MGLVRSFVSRWAGECWKGVVLAPGLAASWAGVHGQGKGCKGGWFFRTVLGAVGRAGQVELSGMGLGFAGLLGPFDTMVKMVCTVGEHTVPPV